MLFLNLPGCRWKKGLDASLPSISPPSLTLIRAALTVAEAIIKIFFFKVDAGSFNRSLFNITLIGQCIQALFHNYSILDFLKSSLSFIDTFT